MINRRFVAIAATAVIVVARAAAAERHRAEQPPAQRRQRGGTGEDDADCTVGVSWNNFQQPRWAATRQAEHAEDRRGRRRHVHRRSTPTSTASSS